MICNIYYCGPICQDGYEQLANMIYPLMGEKVSFMNTYMGMWDMEGEDTEHTGMNKRKKKKKRKGYKSDMDVNVDVDIEMMPEMDEEPMDEITEFRLYINSGGGDIIWGNKIYKLLRDLDTMMPVYTYNVGMAGSMASVVFLAGRRRFACEDSTLFIHRGSGFMIKFEDLGDTNRNKMKATDRSHERYFEYLMDLIERTYEDRTGMPNDMKHENVVNTISYAMMSQSGIFYTAPEQLALGFATDIIKVN